MGWTDWAVSLGLIALVLRQIRGRKTTALGLVWPVGLVVWAGFEYFGDFPAETSDLLFAGALGTLGIALGVGCGLLTKVHREGEDVVVRATLPAAVLWIVGMAGRLAFGIVALHGGAEAIGELSEKLDMHSAETWPTSLILMALCEVVSRSGLLLFQYWKAKRSLPEQHAPAAREPDASLG
ncbi:hypothetical protein ACFRAR_38280 [Kitasatospora sp. NPDC056651]|uniref:hypothetical protein n=1 Tax=Kitasatospora sp. NPDC056651 TaxID=3345892 RepID=UPI00369842EE